MNECTAMTQQLLSNTPGTATNAPGVATIVNANFTDVYGQVATAQSTGTAAQSTASAAQSTATSAASAAAAALSYTPPFTGGVATTVAGKLAQVVSVIDFGADRSGVLDSTAAFTAAAANASSANVELPSGTYKLSSPVAGNFVKNGQVTLTLSGTGNITAPSYGDASSFVIGNQVSVSGSAMQVDNLFENQPAAFPVKNEAGIWTSPTYSYAAISQTFTNTTIPGQVANSGPLTGLFVYANNNGATANVVGLLADAVAQTAGSTAFAANFIARNGNVTNAKCVGLEIDMAFTAGQTVNSGSIGLALNIFNISGSDPTPAIQLGSVGGGTWANGLISSHVTSYHIATLAADPTTCKGVLYTANATCSLFAITLGTSINQGIAFGTGGFGTSPIAFGDVSGNFEIDMGASGAMAFNSPTGVATFTFNKFGNFNMPNNGTIQINSTQVLAQQITGYGTPTGGSHQASFAAGAITLPNLAAAVAQLIVDLKTHGMIGA